MKTLLRLVPARLLTSMPALPSADAPKASAKPNIIFIYADYLGFGDLACYGHPRTRTL
jgi:hypothetical protein